MQPLDLGPNQPERFYRGGGAIAAFRGLPAPGERHPEDWVASTTTLFAEPELGLTRLATGDLLRDRIRADPSAWLGAEHVARFGDDPALLVKLLDAGERLPVHAHPTREFALQHLSSPFGKTEAWLVVSAADGARVHLGFRDDIDEDSLADWVDTQDSAAMLAAMHAVPVRPGDGVLVPAGLPHAVGEGVFLVELQEPTDFSVLLEWDGFALDGPKEGHLGLGYDAALRCVDRRGRSDAEIADLRRVDTGSLGIARPLPPAAEPFFRGERLRPDPRLHLEPGFAVLVVVDGGGVLRPEEGPPLALHRGMTVLVPYAAGVSTLDGDLHVLRCRPPAR
jgi:mannose-6-phosphate isomerase